MRAAEEFVGRDRRDDRLALFCLAMFNLNEFIYVD
jgi:hypothetical protein